MPRGRSTAGVGIWDIILDDLGDRLMAFVPEAPAPRGALRAAVTPSAGTHARAPRPEPGRDSTPLFFRVARARPRRARARVLLTFDHFGGE